MVVNSQDSDDRRAERARKRLTWLVRRSTLDDDGSDRLLAVTTAEERIAMMASLAEEAWRIAGRPIPTYDRAQAPVRRTTLADQ